MTRKILPIVFMTVTALVLCGTESWSTESSLRILVADEPTQCLSLESIFLDGSGYIVIDGRNNTGKVKFLAPDGTITGTAVSTLPLPDAASLPGDILASPWGLDRMVPSSDSFWCVPSAWSGAIVERFDRVAGGLVERRMQSGLRTSGLVVGPVGEIWGVGRRGLVDLTPGSDRILNLGTTVQHIDTVAGHPLGFVVFEQPQLFLIETSGIIRWRISLDGVLDGFVSPTDIAAGPDGSIAICCVVSDLSDPTNHEEYFQVRNECLSQDDEDALFGVEDILRTKLGTGFAIILISPDGTVTDAVDMSTAPIACAVDGTGRVHILLERPDGWGISILDPLLNQGFEVFNLAVGKPGLVSPHRISAGRDGSIYWDDVTIINGEDYWAIGELPASSHGGIFSLENHGTGTAADIPVAQWLNIEALGSFVRQTTALHVTEGGEIYAGYQDFSFDLLGDQIADETLLESPYESMIMAIDPAGNVMRRASTSEITLSPCFLSDFADFGDSTLGILAGTDTISPIGLLNSDGTWSPLDYLDIPRPVANGRIARTSDGYIGWFLAPEAGRLTPRWIQFSSDLSAQSEFGKPGEMGCRLLATDPATDSAFVTIDDGEIFQMDTRTGTVMGIWQNRLGSGAPAHPLDDAARTNDGIAILDLEHRAILLVSFDAFTIPPVASDLDSSEALTAIRSALDIWKQQYGFYPPPSPGLLDTILEIGDREKVNRAFLGGRIYHYEPTNLGYTFTAWSAEGGQPVLICGMSDTQEIY